MPNRQRDNKMKRNVIKLFKSDVFRYYGDCSTKTIIKGCISKPTIRFLLALRMCQGSGLIRRIGIVLWILNRSRRRIVIPPETKIGYGLYIAHGGPVVISPTAVIGNNVNLSQFTTIGSNHGHAATIGDGTYIGPNVCIVENVNIGKNVTIGAGSVVTKDIPDNATACGNYAKVINYDNPGRYTQKNRWMDCSD